MSYTHYLKVKNKICIYHEGNTPEYLVQLRMLAPTIEKYFPGIHVSFAGRDHYLNWLSPHPSIMSIAEFVIDKMEFALNISVTFNASQEKHPVHDLVGCPIISYPIKGSVNHFGIICPEGSYPTKSLDAHQINHLRSWVTGRGFLPLVVGTSPNETNLPIDKRPSSNERQKLAREAGLVVGVECDMLFEAVSAGIPTALVPTGVGQKLYEAFCKKPVILSV